MNLKSSVLPESFLRCLDPVERKKLVDGQITWQEALSRGEAKNERQLQVMIVNLLRLHGIEPLWHRTDKKSAATIGWPDITFAIRSHNIERWSDDSGMTTTDLIGACAWEVKFGNGQLSKEQEQMHIRLSTPPNSWRIKVIRSVDEALSELRELGIPQQ